MEKYLILIVIVTLLIFLIRTIQIAVIENCKLQRKMIEHCNIYSFGLSKEDFDFLIDLQHEMLTQDHVSQAAPRFWVVATDKYQELGTEDCFDGINLYSSDDADIVCNGDMSSIIEYIKEYYSDKLERKNMVFTDKDDHWYAKFNEDEETFYCSEELLDFLKEHHIIADSYELVYYRNVHHIYPNTMFLTNRSCKEHIKANHYHYNDDAHSYAMTAWRSPEVSQLFEILEKINWNIMKENAYGTDSKNNTTVTDSREGTE